MSDRLYVDPRSCGDWEVGDYYNNLILEKDELLEFAHLLIKAYRRECQKEEMGL